jgi:hypothetical protein
VPSLYHAIAATLHVITYDPLRLEWFCSLVVNLWLWSKASSGDLLHIIAHWSTAIVPSFPELFRDGICFFTLINQYLLFFCPGGPASSIEITTPLLDASYTSARVIECGDAFCDFVARAGHVSLVAGDSGPIHTHIAHCSDKRTLLRLMDLLIGLSGSIVTLKGFINTELLNFHSFLKMPDVDVIVQTILVLHELMQHQAHLHMVAAAYEIAHNVAEEVFRRVLAHLPLYPNVFPLLTILGLRLGEAQMIQTTAALGLLARAEQSIIRLHPYRTWFLYPFLLALRVDSSRRLDVCVFVTAVISTHKHKVRKLVPRVVSFLVFLRTIADFGAGDADLANIFLIAVKQMIIDWPDLGGCITGDVLALTLFRSAPASPRAALLEEFARSPFAQDNA